MSESSEPIDVEIISEERLPEKQRKPTPIVDEFLKEVDETLNDFEAPKEFHDKLEERADDIRDAYLTGEQVFNGVKKTIPKAQKLIEKMTSAKVFGFSGKREMMPRSK